MKTINKYLIKYDIPHRKNLNIIKINKDKNRTFTFGILEKPIAMILKLLYPKKEEKSKDSIMRKVSVNSNNNLVIKRDKQKEKRNNEKFDYISFTNDLEGFKWDSFPEYTVPK